MYCCQQLADFQKRIGLFEQRGVNIIAASIDDREGAQKTLDRYKPTFPLAYGLDAKEFAAQTGAFYNAEKGFLNATGFIIRPDGLIGGASYSTGPIGRYTPVDCIRMIDYWLKQPRESKPPKTAS